MRDEPVLQRIVTLLDGADCSYQILEHDVVSTALEAAAADMLTDIELIAATVAGVRHLGIFHLGAKRQAVRHKIAYRDLIAPHGRLLHG